MNKLLISTILLLFSSQLLGGQNVKDEWKLRLSCYKKDEVRVVNCDYLNSKLAPGDSTGEVTWSLNGKVYSKKRKFENVSLAPGKYIIAATVVTKKGFTLTDEYHIIEDRSEAKIKFKWGDEQHSTMILLIENGELAGSSKTNDAGEEVFVPSSPIRVQQWMEDGIDEAAASVGELIEISKNRLKFKKIHNQMVSLRAIDSKGLKIYYKEDVSEK